MRTLVSHIYSFFQCVELNSAFKSIFQKQVMEWFLEHYGAGFEMETKIPIGNPEKDHKFDIVNLKRRIVIECKRYTWTAKGNVPSAKTGFTNEAAFYLSFLPDNYVKYIIMLRSYHQKRNETLAEYYFRTYRHLLDGVIVAEFDSESNRMSVVGSTVVGE